MIPTLYNIFLIKSRGNHSILQIFCQSKIKRSAQAASVLLGTKQLAFLGIGKKAAFDKYGGMPDVIKHEYVP